MTRTTLATLAAATLLALAAGSAVPADAAKKRSKGADKPTAYQNGMEILGISWGALP